MKEIGKRGGPAMVVAVIALVLALTGTSYAVAKLGKDTVGAKQLRTVTYRTATAALNANGAYAEATATCEPKEQVVGGGVSVDNQNVNEFTAVLEDGPETNGWHARMQNGGVNNLTITVTALCLAK